MLSFLQRLVAPERTASLKHTEAERDFINDRLIDAEREVRELKEQAKAAQKSSDQINRHLISIICQLAGGKPVPPVSTEKPEPINDDDKLTLEQTNLLWQRAEEACRQKITDRDITQADIDIEYAAMMKDPLYYLTN